MTNDDPCGCKALSLKLANLIVGQSGRVVECAMAQVVAAILMENDDPPRAMSEFGHALLHHMANMRDVNVTVQ